MNLSFFKVPVHIHSSFWFFLLFFSFDPSFSIIEIFLLGIVLMISFLIHEYGHALGVAFFGAKPEINLQAFFGYVTCQDGKVTKKQDCLAILSGMVSTLALIICSHYCLKENFFNLEYLSIFLYYMLKLNTLWLITNMAPLEPLDGGRLLVNFLTNKMGEKKGVRVSRSIGNISAIIGASYFLSHGHYFFGTLFLFLGFNNLQKIDSLQKKNHHLFQGEV